MTPRDELTLWCREFLPGTAAITGSPALTPVSGDAGFRVYFRLNSIPALIAVHAPPEHEDVPSFVEKALFFRSHGLATPEVLAVDYRRGFMLLEDLGDRLLLPELNADNAETLYDLAEDTLHRIQQLPRDERIFPGYDADKLLRELELFPDWFVGKLLGLPLGSGERQMLEQVFRLLIDNALEQPQVVVHRDYHSRNLLLKNAGRLGMVDFQDAVIGPICYDLVSLLRDCYVRWPGDYVYRRAANYYSRCINSGLLPQQTGLDQFKQWFDVMGLQRHLKVLGIFARLWLRDGKRQYLRDLPLVIRYTLEQCAASPAMAEFREWFLDRLMPAITTQDWYRHWQSAGDRA